MTVRKQKLIKNVKLKQYLANLKFKILKTYLFYRTSTPEHHKTCNEENIMFQTAGKYRINFNCWSILDIQEKLITFSILDKADDIPPYMPIQGSRRQPLELPKKKKDKCSQQ